MRRLNTNASPKVINCLVLLETRILERFQRNLNPRAFGHVYGNYCGHLVCNLGLRLTIASVMIAIEQKQTEKSK